MIVFEILLASIGKIKILHIHGVGGGVGGKGLERMNVCFNGQATVTPFPSIATAHGVGQLKLRHRTSYIAATDLMVDEGDLWALASGGTHVRDPPAVIGDG